MVLIQSGNDQYGSWQDVSINGVVQRFRWIPAGDFLMDAPVDDSPRRVVIEDGFWLGDTPVTQDLWSAVMGDNPSYYRGRWRPVERVSWNDCQRFLASLPEPDAGWRLPSEAEWEHACRAGPAHVPDQSLDQVAWYEQSTGTRPVATKAPSPLGLYDMLGNVWEWCSTTTPDSLGMGPARVVRGGSWRSYARYVRAAYRGARRPAARYVSLGFRLARSA